jgi:hypothetical protein
VRAGWIVGSCVGLIVPALVLSSAAHRPPSVHYVSSGIDTSSQPLGPAGKDYALTEAIASIRPNRLILPHPDLANDNSIKGIWATGGQDAETYIEYDTGIIVTEQVPSWTLSTALPRASGAPTDVASAGRAFLGDGGGAKGLITQIDGHDAFVAYASDPSGAEGPGSVMVEIAGSEVSVIGTTNAISMQDLYDTTSAIIQAGESIAPAGA